MAIEPKTGRNFFWVGGFPIRYLVLVVQRQISFWKMLIA